MKQLTVPNTGLKLTDGSIVILAEYPDTKWITHYGWYNYNDQQQMGWYFCSIPNQSILPVTSDILRYVTLVSDSGGCPHGPHLPPPPPRPVPIVPQSELIDQINRSFISVDTISERDELDTTNFSTGKLVRVNDVEGQPKYYQWDQTKQMWISVVLEKPINNFIYFKKECNNWTEPKIYFYNEDKYGSDHFGGEKADQECWNWDDSPYMLKNDEGYYYYPLLEGYNNVVFFCDEKDRYGWNYKTPDLTIPSKDWYTTPLFVQSEIGYSGFWADYNTKQTKLLVQMNQDLFNSSNMYKETSLEATYIDIFDNTITPKIYDFGLVVNGAFPNSYSEPFKSLYNCVQLPIDFKKLSLTIKASRSATFELFLHEMCYQYPVAYASTTSTVLNYFDAVTDENLKHKLVDNNREVELRLNRVYSEYTHLSEYGRIPDASQTVSSAGSTRTYSISNCFYYKIGNVVHIWGQASCKYLQGSPDGPSCSFPCLPFSSAIQPPGDFSGIWNTLSGRSRIFISPHSTMLRLIEMSSTSTVSGYFNISYIVHD